MKNLKLKIKNCGHIISITLVCTFALLALSSVSSAAVITNVEPTSVSDTDFVVTWTTTDETSSTEILWGISAPTQITTLASSNKYHYAELTGLMPETTYYYRLKSGSSLYPPESQDALSFKTLQQPSGQYLFSFAVINDLRYAEGKANVSGSRGVPYQYCDEIVSAEVDDINNHSVAFTVINGAIVDNDSSQNYGDQMGTQVKTRLENLSGASDLPSGFGYKYLPTSGYEDKQAAYSSDWISDGFQPLTSDPGSSESRYGYSASDANSDSVFNYQFNYKYHNFIFLDSAKANGEGLVSLEAVNNYLSSNPDTKAFVFMNYPGYDPFDSETKDYPIDIPTSEISYIAPNNATVFRATLESFATTEVAGETEYPLVAAVVSGHIGDNYKRKINGINYIRQAQAVGYPTGYSIYKVYSNGFVKTFYKTSGRDSSNKPYYEHARDQLASGEGLTSDVLASFWLGSNSLRNFTVTYPFIPGLPPEILTTSPSTGATRVKLNQPIQITFNKRMSEQSLDNWVSISPQAGTITASFLDSERTILQVDHSNDFSLNQTYTVTVSASLALDEGSRAMAQDYTFSFSTSGFSSGESTSDTAEPIATVAALQGDSSSDPFPQISLVATDESGVANLYYYFDSLTNWLTAEASDAKLGGTRESFVLTPSTALSTGSHQLWLRTIDTIGNSSEASGFLAYSFTISSNKPVISLTIDGQETRSGDPIDSTPKIETIITSQNSLASSRILIDSTASSLTTVNSGNNYYATYEVTTALSDGSHSIAIEATDNLGNTNTYEVEPVYVESNSAVAVQGSALNYPNPFDPGSESTAIGYTLSKAANITLRIFDLSGNLIVKRTYLSAQTGGKAGYNEISWDGKSDTGSYVGNGIYLFVLIADGAVLPNGKGKITVFKR